MSSKPHSRSAKLVRVTPSIRDPRLGVVSAGAMRFRCALGRGGVRRGKREGDGATPAGTLALGAVWWRADIAPPPATRAPRRRICADDGWCDMPRHRRYNHAVRLPFAASHERLHRDDGIYDIVVETGWNRRPAVQGRGSAIFMHVARPGFPPTEGCVALRLNDLRKLLTRVGPTTRLLVGADAPRRARSRP